MSALGIIQYKQMQTPGDVWVKSDGLTGIYSKFGTGRVGDSSISSIAWNGSVFCMLANDNIGATTCHTSSNGIDWTAQPNFLLAHQRLGINTIYTYQWMARKVAADPVTGRFCAVGQACCLVSDDNGVTWNLRDSYSAVVQQSWTAQFIVFLQNKFIVSLNAGTTTARLAVSSDNGETWTAPSISWSTSSASVGYVFSMASNGSLLVATGYDSIATSTDGTTWTPRNGAHTVMQTGQAGAVDRPTSVTFDQQNSVFVALGDSTSRLISSSNGITWTLIYNPALLPKIIDPLYTTETSEFDSSIYSAADPAQIFYYNGNVYLIGGLGNIALNSNSAANDSWTVRSIEGAGRDTMVFEILNTSSFMRIPVIGGSSGNIILSPASGSNGSYIYSGDFGNTWSLNTELSLSNTYPFDASWSDTSEPAIGFNGNTYIVVGNYGRYGISANANVWIPDNLQKIGSDWISISKITSVAWNGNVFCVVGYSNTYHYNTNYARTYSMAATSPDGVNWTHSANSVITFANIPGGPGNISNPQASSVSSVVWGDNQFVAAGSLGAIYTSPNGQDWVYQSQLRNGTSWGTTQIGKVIWTGNTYVAIPSSAISSTICATSPNAVIWSTQTISGFNGNTIASVGSNGRTHIFLANPSSGNSRVLISNNLSSWTNISSFQSLPQNTSRRFRSVIWTGLDFFISTSLGEVFTSKNGVDWNIRTYSYQFATPYLLNFQMAGGGGNRETYLQYAGGKIFLAGKYGITAISSY